jgi:tetratricopeptide (TPR) repeat protein
VGKKGVQALPFSRFQSVLANLRSIGVPQPEGSLRRHYLKCRDELLTTQKARAGKLTVAERINLSAYLIRLQQYEEAVAVLSPAREQEPHQFMVLANLATAEQLAGRLDRAISDLQQVKDYWPRQWPDLSDEQLAWYRQVETYHLKLLRLRNHEAERQPAARSRQPENVDGLFGTVAAPIRFVGDSGKYEAGRLAAAERARLPGDATAIVQQLLIWLPDDLRLYWLYGELLNAGGDTASAAVVFDSFWSRNWSPAALVEHRRIVKEAVPKASDPAAETWASEGSGVGGQGSQDRPTGGWLPDTRQLVLVAGLAGAVVVFLGYLQVREFRRRRKDEG